MDSDTEMPQAEDFDSKSLASTSCSDEQSEYEVEAILAEREFDDGLKYLVQWSGYPSHRNTWEPAEMFDSNETLDDWESKKQEIAQKRSTPFDVASWEKHCELVAQRKEERRRRREAKRAGMVRVDVDHAENTAPASTTSISAGRNSGLELLVAPTCSRKALRRLPPHKPQALAPQTQPSVAKNQTQPAEREKPSKPPVTKPASLGFGVGQTSRPGRRDLKWGEREPDISQLELMKPSEFTPRVTTASATTLPISMTENPSAPKDQNSTSSIKNNASTASSVAQKPNKNSNPHTGAGHTSPKPAPAMPPPSYNSNRRESPRGSADTSQPDHSKQPEHFFRGDCYRYEYSECTDTFRWSVSGSYRPLSDRTNRRHSPSPPCSLPTVASRKNFSSTPQRPLQPEAKMATSSQASTLSVEAQIARMPSKKLPGAMVTRGGYFWNPGEILVHLFFGPNKKYIGATRLCGSSTGAKAELIGTKGKNPRLEMWFKELCNLEDYGMLCERAPNNRLWCNSWLEGFHDTNSALFIMAEQLHRQNVIAIHYPPHNGNVWLAYSRWSQDFGFLHEEANHLPDEVPIFLVARNMLPPVTCLEPRGMVQQSQRPQANTMFPQNALPSGVQFSPHGYIGSMRNSGLFPGDQAPPNSYNSISTGQAVGYSPDPRLKGQSSTSQSSFPTRDQGLQSNGEPALPQLSKFAVSNTSTTGNYQSPAVNQSIIPRSIDPISNGTTLTPEAEALLQYFNTAKITMNELATIYDSGEASLAEFFICISPWEIQRWKWTDWKKFIRNSRRGVAVFHESFFDYHKLRPMIREEVPNDSLNVWSIRLLRPLQLPDLRYCSPGTHMQRIFPKDRIFLVTEDVLADLKGTAILLRWFYQSQRPGRRPWKIMFFPDIMGWLERKLSSEPRNTSADNLVLTIITLIMKINSIDGNPPIDPRTINPNSLDRLNHHAFSLSLPGYGNRAEQDDPTLPKGLTQEERNADHLIQAFAGWSIVNAARFGRFIVITSLADDVLKSRWREFGHLNIQGPLKNVFDKFKVPHAAIWDLLQHGPSKHKGDSSSTATAPQAPIGPVSVSTPQTPVDPPSSTPQTPANPPTAKDADAMQQNQWKAPVRHDHTTSWQ
ncbi:hypothetical protein NUU61_001068 [Penicillium alfredii]|uniref:Chromo domain-containing protein n=1 Tax=Penicillium alfredii TaxID=1506179 RepID=A0A9W9GB88_9EURO|nr:uncharacterized protein NUU61_001068 [Penicillium alfredii]KAJ5115309.1 hypothetical protein NUU61_001068 [Penicillium alfredii]